MLKKISMLFALILAVGVLYSATIAKAADFEPNDHFDTANSISFVKDKITVNGILNTSEDVDYYLFTLPKPGKVEIKINQNLNTRYEVSLYTVQQNKLEDYYTNYNIDKGPEELFSQGLDAGTYYVKVEQYDRSNNNVPYTLSINYTESSYYEKEFNNDRSSADRISMNKKYYGWADASYDNDDYYLFEVPASGEVKIDMKSTLSTQFNMRLYNNAGDLVEDWYSYYGSEIVNMIHTGLPKGIYYIRVNAYEGSRYNVPYEFKVSFSKNSYFETEGNDSLDLANPIQMNKAFKGVISNSSDIDYYVLNTSKNTNLSLYLTHAQDTGFLVEVFDQDKKFDQYIYTNYGSGNLKKTMDLNFKKGIYYIKVRRDKGEYRHVPYTIKVIQRDITPPKIPSIKKVTSKTTTILGMAESGSTVYVYKGNKVIGKGVTTSTGKYSVKIAKQKKGTTLTVYAKDKAGNKSSGKKVKVQ